MHYPPPGPLHPTALRVHSGGAGESGRDLGNPARMNVLGVPFPGPLTTAGWLARGMGGVALTAVERLGGGRQRRAVWTCPGRVYIEAHGVHGPAGAPVARRIE